jgi:hypothetical protein
MIMQHYYVNKLPEHKKRGVSCLCTASQLSEELPCELVPAREIMLYIVNKWHPSIAYNRMSIMAGQVLTVSKGLSVLCVEAHSPV